MRLLILLFVLSPYCFYSQSIEGIVYDSEAIVRGAKIENTRTKFIVYSGDKGEFKINAKLNDTILVSSFFHELQQFIPKTRHFENKVVIELKKVVNALEKVDVVKQGEKIFSVEEMSKASEKQIEEDIKNNPHLYDTSSDYGLDFIRLGTLLGLFKSKKAEHPKPITYEQYVHLFRTENLFSETLLYYDFKIPKPQTNLFFEYCENKKMNSDLLKTKNRLILLDSMYLASKEFLKLLETASTKD